MIRLYLLGLFASCQAYSRPATGTLTRIFHHTGKSATHVPLLGTSSAGRKPLTRHCLSQAVAHSGQKSGLEDR